MNEIIDVSTGEVRVGGSKTILRAIAIGSCIVIAAYDPKQRIGAMAHVMLPGSAPKKAAEKTKYAADAIDKMIKDMAAAGSNKDDIEVCLVGGGNVLNRQDDTICKDNIDSTTGLLRKKQIPVRSSALGGTERKGVFLNVENGSISCTEGDKKEKLLWKPKARLR
ncbi:MAG: chemotaxis protein CheD [Planctomycetota bacterium]|jgi:chemotaxis protein CheD